MNLYENKYTLLHYTAKQWHKENNDSVSWEDANQHDYESSLLSHRPIVLRTAFFNHTLLSLSTQTHLTFLTWAVNNSADDYTQIYF